MKNTLFTFLLLTTTITAMTQNNNPNYDAKLAKTLGADDYGMKKYILVILKTGTNTTTDKVITDSLFTGHMDNIRRLVDLNKLIVAGTTW